MMRMWWWWLLMMIHTDDLDDEEFFDLSSEATRFNEIAISMIRNSIIIGSTSPFKHCSNFNDIVFPYVYTVEIIAAEAEEFDDGIATNFFLNNNNNA